MKKADAKTVYYEGTQARYGGQACEENPYPEHSRERRAWDDGWRFGDLMRRYQGGRVIPR